MNILKQLLEERGLDLRSAHKLGVPYHALQKQLKGLRGVGPKSALLYEKILGIPKSVLRPDLWPPCECSSDKCPKGLGASNESSANS